MNIKCKACGKKATINTKLPTHTTNCSCGKQFSVLSYIEIRRRAEENGARDTRSPSTRNFHNLLTKVSKELS